LKLNNGEIFTAREPLAKLLGEKFPVKVAYGLAKLANKLNDQLKVIDDVRNGLIKTYGEADPDNKQQIRVNPEGENFVKFAEGLNELFAKEENIDIQVVKLPEKVAATCDKCNHNMDKMLEIEPSILMVLEKFVEVS